MFSRNKSPHCLLRLARAGMTVALVVSSQSLSAACPQTPGSTTIPEINLQLVAKGLNQPVHITHAGDGSSRLFIVEQAGIVRNLNQGQLVSRPFLDIQDRVESGGEKGLLSMAFHPRYRKNGYVFVNYTTRRDGLKTVISRFKRFSHDQIDPKSEFVLLEINQPYGNHNGGQMAFGPDGYLYIGMGDGGAAGDPLNHGQNTKSLLGALLRIDVNRKSGEVNYAIPDDNPFVKNGNFRPEVWAYGLRNPWRFSFDKVTGQLYLADVGQDAVEEIDIISKGGNYGWNIMEGDFCYSENKNQCQDETLKPPVHVYYHPEGFSVTGGYVYRGNRIPALCGTYLFADYVTEKIWGIRVYKDRTIKHKKLISKGNLVRHTLSRIKPVGLNISTFGEDENGELYVADHGRGHVYKIVPNQ